MQPVRSASGPLVWRPLKLWRRALQSFASAKSLRLLIFTAPKGSDIDPLASRDRFWRQQGSLAIVWATSSVHKKQLFASLFCDKCLWVTKCPHFNMLTETKACNQNPKYNAFCSNSSSGTSVYQTKTPQTATTDATPQASFCSRNAKCR